MLPVEAREIDHLVLPVESLDVARDRLSVLGFTVAPDARHPFGTENACVFFADDTYLEPLGIGSREDCEAAARLGNVFVARYLAYRFRQGEGLSGVVVKTSDAASDDRRYRAEGLSAGDILNFSRTMTLGDGSSFEASFRLAFAADLRAPDFLLFSCQRLNPLPADRGSLVVHKNGAVGLSRIVLVEENPSDFQYLLEMGLEQRAANAHSFGLPVEAANCQLDILTPQGFVAHFSFGVAPRGRGLFGGAVVLAVGDLKVTEAYLTANAVAYQKIGARLVVPPSSGQGVVFAFEEKP
ncbi:VOC family protein [Peteryoungia desertarenae]|uniref:VOC family protein n=1 Tax=Peteryoungia desertarenae TaxID=1813451 RepID=A0ABX6QP46_9HYPH|nr:VOC family protein [Peteryoungia desertarenae]QLF70391.1 VOC family protein [Peteryoungia desertarenae]